jgi:hypothetical protein
MGIKGTIETFVSQSGAPRCCRRDAQPLFRSFIPAFFILFLYFLPHSTKSHPLVFGLGTNSSLFQK